MPNRTADLRVRDARLGEGDHLAALTVAAYQQYAEVLGPFWEHYRQDILAAVRQPAVAAQPVAVLEGRIVGAVLLYPAGVELAAGAAGSVVTDAPEVRLLAVAPEARGRGVGEALMRECIRRARAAGAASLTLHTTGMMVTAMRLYARLGFGRAVELDFQPVPGATAEGYRLRLAPD